jgi:hypothetical protein
LKRLVSPSMDTGSPRRTGIIVPLSTVLWTKWLSFVICLILLLPCG